MYGSAVVIISAFECLRCLCVLTIVNKVAVNMGAESLKKQTRVKERQALGSDCFDKGLRPTGYSLLSHTGTPGKRKRGSSNNNNCYKNNNDTEQQ